MQVKDETDAKKPDPVTVVVGRGQGIRQPDTFRVCPLGIQLYSKKSIPEFELLEFNIDVPGNNGTPEAIKCTGVVVHCRPEKESPLYRVWVKFLDLPESERSRIQCVAKHSKFLCPYCENF